jgi:hypothetical protein
MTVGSACGPGRDGGCTQDWGSEPRWLRIGLGQRHTAAPRGRRRGCEGGRARGSGESRQIGKERAGRVDGEANPFGKLG